MNNPYHKKSFSKIPIFEEISTPDFQLPQLIKLFKTKRIGQLPYYIVLHDLEDEQLQEALDNISEALITLKLNPYFPYPFYVVSDKIEHHSHLPIVQAVNELPRHYFQKARRLKNKEMTLLNKNSILGAKIANLDMNTQFKTINEVTSGQRQLFDLCKEVDFYERIFQQMNKNAETEEDHE